MPYSRQAWVNGAVGGTPVSAARLTHMEDGIGATLPVFNARSTYGADGDGVGDDTSAIQAAITAAAAAGGIAYLPAGTYKVTSALAVSADLHGAGRSAVLVPPAGFAFPVLKVDAATVRISGLRIEKASGAAAAAGGYGVSILGAADGCLVDHVEVTGVLSGFHVAGHLGAAAGTVRRVRFTNCRANSSGQYGFELDEVTGVEIAHCQSVVSGLDGVKLRRKTRDVVLIGGYFTGATGGDGLDAYAGGDTFSITGGVYSGNAINGITIKNDDLGRTDPGTYGYVRSVNVVGAIAHDNGGNGITCHRSDGNPDDATEPLVTRANFVGCSLVGNTNYGLYLSSRQVTATGVHAARNGLTGIYLEPACLDVTLVGVHAAGNSQTSTNAHDGIRVAGSRIQIIGGSSVGSDPDGATSDSDLSGGTKTQRYGLRIESAATQVDVYGINLSHNATSGLSDLSAAARLAAPPAQVNYLGAGRYAVPGGTRSTLAMLSEVEYATPMWLGEGGTVVRIGCEVTVAGTAGTVIRLGIRDTIARSDPGPVLGQGTVAGDAIASVEATVSITIPGPGLYWLTATAQSTGVTLPTIRASLANNPPVWHGTLGTALSASPLSGFQTAAGTSGTLPSTYTVSNRSATAPLIAIRT